MEKRNQKGKKESEKGKMYTFSITILLRDYYEQTKEPLYI